ncbi:BglII/BstYI family type II restriction endonuclease [Thioalkalivibrio sp. ALJ2]|uniref:BglII/BstYI family type II restriction endonuclease n=1 Tax=Thioalkalivibrio sp. ALJ2 TaxID=1261622 RepID=UPI00035FDB51|nr:BglII/BstYI family type II restriction endonuclease [Thioalkalivibrio sp. ALJ2]
MGHEQDPQQQALDTSVLSEAEANADDVALSPGVTADDPGGIEPYISEEIRQLYDVYSYRHAAALLATEFPDELKDIERALLRFRITKTDIGMPGGNESEIPKKISTTLRPAGWVEARIRGDLVVRMQEHSESFTADGKAQKTKRPEVEPKTIENFIDGHKIDYVKGRVAFDLEWNSKDQTFDRDLYAMRAFHECGLVSAGIMLTRSEKLDPVFREVPQLDRAGNTVKSSVKSKYGASTTWMGKLLYRLNAGRNGGCPVLVFGITPRLIHDWNEHEQD